MGNNPSYNKYGDNYPVEGISWDDCQAFITKLNQRLGGNPFRLPTEAE
ncbi:MAG: SUMF1/EgtB/PvdO family nonheme iron enzyme, partial [Candidatus Aminicenantes bacterium]|nr:SUMF1/EgtB/PvdO family nonheme iron enzyme [Candidatus Aminicenantes bacterium]